MELVMAEVEGGILKLGLKDVDKTILPRVSVLLFTG